MTVAACERFQSGTFPRWDSRLFRDTIDRFGIALDAKVSQLSRGQRAGVSLALTLQRGLSARSRTLWLILSALLGPASLGQTRR